MNYYRVTIQHVFICTLLLQSATAQVVVQTKSPQVKLEDIILSPKIVSAEDLKDQEYDYSARASLLRGWDKDGNRITEESCVEGIPRDSKSILVRAVDYSEVFDRETINLAFKLTADATYGAATAKTEYARKVDVDRSSRVIIGTASISGGGQVVGSAARLTTRALEVLGDTKRTKADRLSDFFTLCGDSWISEIRHGAQLSTVFRVALNNETIDETFKLGGGFDAGAAKARADAESTLKNQKEQSSIKFEQRRWGGPEVVAATTATGVMKQLQDFSNAPSNEITPFTLIVSNYQSLGNWPPDLKYTSLSPRIRRLLSGHISRLRTLENVYKDAATEPSSFYFPFDNEATRTARSAHLVERADVLRDAARCLENIVNYCSRMSQCYSISVLVLDGARGLCPALDQPESQFNAQVAAAVLGTNPADLPTTAPKQLVPALQRVAKQLNRPLGTRALTSSESNFSPATIYYQFLAESPIRRNWNPDFATRDILDDTKQIELYCGFLKVDCAGVAYEKISGKVPTADTDPAALSLYRQWVIRTRLLPVRGSFCNLDSDHPMCRPLAELVAVTDRLIPRFGEERNFGPAPPAIRQPDRRPEVPCKSPRPGPARDCGGGLI